MTLLSSCNQYSEASSHELKGAALSKSVKPAAMAPKARGELGEIKSTLATLATTGNAKSEAVLASKRDVFKKIINYMTIGIDMSSLFIQARPLHSATRWAQLSSQTTNH